MYMDFSSQTITEIRVAVVSSKVTAVDVIRSVLADIQERDQNIGAFLETFDEHALDAARRIDELSQKEKEALPLAGVPVAIKDNMLIAGQTASSASKILQNYRASYTATVVSRLEAAGAIIIGRTNMDEFAMGGSTENSGLQKTVNPHNHEKIPGGSSGGSAAAVAAGFVPLALASDTGGSIRQPAAMCGVVGMKPTYGRVSRYGLMAMASSLDQIGPFARTVEDAALCLSIIEGRDEHDGTSVKLDEKVELPLSKGEKEGVGGSGAQVLRDLRIGVPREYFIDGMDAGVRAAVEQAIAKLKEHGAEIVQLSLPLTPYALPVYYIIQPAEVSSNLGRYDGMRYGTRAPGNLEESYLAARSEGFGPEVKRRIMLGSFVLSAGYYDAFYKKALAVRNALVNEFNAAFEKVDVIISPTAPTVAWNIGEKVADPLAMYLADVLTAPANIAGLPAISIPCGKVDGLPIGLQFQGKAFDDEKVLAVAAAFEKLIQ